MPASSHPVGVLQHLGPSFPHCYCYGHNPISSGPAKHCQPSEKLHARQAVESREEEGFVYSRFNRKTSRTEIHLINESASISSTVPVAIEWRPFLSELLYMSKNLLPQLSFPDIDEGFRNVVRIRLRRGWAVTKIAHVPTRSDADLTFIQIASVSVTKPPHFRNAGETFCPGWNGRAHAQVLRSTCSPE